MDFLLFRFLSKFFRMVTMNSESVQLRVHGLGPLDAYHVTEDELDRITRDGSDLGTEFAFAQFGLTIALSFLANLLITPLPLGKTYVVYVVIIVGGLFFGLANGIRWYRGRGAFNRTIQKIRDRRVGPVGSQGKEISASDLQQLPSTPAQPEAEHKS